ncbi:mangetout [Carabus blaptoides fortunei]
MVDIVRLMGWSYVSLYEESNYGIKVTMSFLTRPGIENKSSTLERGSERSSPITVLGVVKQNKWALDQSKFAFQLTTIAALRNVHNILAHSSYPLLPLHIFKK